MARTVRSVQGDSVDRLCYRHYGTTAGVVEQVYAANPRLCELGPVLPIATPVTLPDLNTPSTTQRTTVQLWD